MKLQTVACFVVTLLWVPMFPLHAQETQKSPFGYVNIINTKTIDQGKTVYHLEFGLDSSPGAVWSTDRADYVFQVFWTFLVHERMRVQYMPGAANIDKPGSGPILEHFSDADVNLTKTSTIPDLNARIGVLQSQNATLTQNLSSSRQSLDQCNRTLANTRQALEQCEMLLQNGQIAKPPKQ